MIDNRIHVWLCIGIQSKFPERAGVQENFVIVKIFAYRVSDGMRDQRQILL